MVLETAVEGGWLAGGALLLFVGSAIRRGRRIVASSLGGAAYGLLIYAVVNAMVSSDINGNRPVFFFSSLVLLLARRPALHADDRAVQERAAPGTHSLGPSTGAPRVTSSSPARTANA
jgi:hypothetical protein